MLSKIAPVGLMIGLGFFCRKKNIISSEGNHAVKTLVTTFMLPVLLFHALATAVYNGDTLKIVLVMLLQLSVTFGVGMLLRKHVTPYGEFLPFILSGFEGGMIGYPLYSVICGEENLSKIATVDIANTMFVFTIFLAVLMAQVSGKFKLNAMVKNVLHSTVFWGVFAGIFLGVSGMFSRFLASSVGSIYLSAEEMMTSAVSACILIVVGFELNLKGSMVKACMKSVLIRLVLQTLALAGVMLLLGDVASSEEMRIAIILYGFMPPTYVISAYSRKREDGEYLSTTLSLYTVISIIAFIVINLFY